MGSKTKRLRRETVSATYRDCSEDLHEFCRQWFNRHYPSVGAARAGAMIINALITELSQTAVAAKVGLMAIDELRDSVAELEASGYGRPAGWVPPSDKESN